MKILVTGGAGYIGSVVVEQLIAAGESVVVFDNFSQGHRAAVHPDAVFVEGDLADRAAIDAALSQHRPDAVMHFASKTLVGESMQKPFLYLGDNVTTGLNLLQSMVEHEVKRIILSSTANLFDQPERMPIDESERIIPGSPYGESKFILERMLHWLDRIYSVRFACLRYFNAAGRPPRGAKTTPRSFTSSRSCFRLRWASARKCPFSAQTIRLATGHACAIIFMSLIWRRRTFWRCMPSIVVVAFTI